MMICICALVFLPHDVVAFQFGVLVMGISDPLAGWVGERFGAHPVRVFGHRKSLEGSLAFFLSSLALAFLFVPALGYEMFLIAAFLTLVECCLVYGLDNLFLPLAGAFFINFLF